jgi:hypothetical protein
MPLESGESTFMGWLARPWGKAPEPAAGSPNLSGARFGLTTEGEDCSIAALRAREVVRV